MQRVFIIRFSSLGDVAISVPLICSLAKLYPEVQFFMLSKPSLAPMFKIIHSNVTFKAIETNGRYKSLFELYRVFRELDIKRTDTLCDLHDNIRSKILGFLFLLWGASYYHIDKERKSKRKLTRKYNKVFKPLVSSFDRYKAVFDKAGFTYDTKKEAHLDVKLNGNIEDVTKLWGVKANHWIGIAPFAKHFGKIYPLDKMIEVVARFAQDKAFTVFLFGGGAEEISILETWKRTYPSLKSSYGTGFGKEIMLMSCLDLMVTMDSANLHLASMVGTMAISIWGATHPYAGFYGLGQKETNAIQTDLSCRPCSVYGDKACYRGDYACMKNISPEQIIKKIESTFSLLCH